MSTLSKEFQGIFIPLSATDLVKLSYDETLKYAYLDGISYMHDLVSSFIDSPDHQYFKVNEAIINCGVIKKRFFEDSDSLSKHFTHNFEVAHYYAAQSHSIIAADTMDDIIILRRDATSYIKGLLHTYNLVRTIQ
jgi:hypothetical protein